MSITSVSSPAAYLNLLACGRAASRRLRIDGTNNLESPRVEGLRATAIAAAIYDRVQERSLGGRDYKKVTRQLQAAQPPLKPDETKKDREFKLNYAKEQRKKFIQNCYFKGAGALILGLVGAATWVEASNARNTNAPALVLLESEKDSVVSGMSPKDMRIIRSFSSSQPANLAGESTEHKAELVDTANRLEILDQTISDLKFGTTARYILSALSTGNSFLLAFSLMASIYTRQNTDPEVNTSSEINQS